MEFCVLGLNHKRASLDLRDVITANARLYFKNRRMIQSHVPWSGVLLTTCNRCEFYFCSASPEKDHFDIKNILLRGCQTSMHSSFQQALYFYRSFDAFAHLHQVCCGLDSAILGETQILGQVKKAYTHAHQHQKLSSSIHFAFSKCLQFSKKFRQHFLPSPLALPLFQQVRTHLPDKKSSILLIGASATNEHFIHQLNYHGYTNLSLIHRSQTKRSLHLKTNFPHISHLEWKDRIDWKSYNYVIIATKSNSVLDVFQTDYPFQDSNSKPMHTQLIIDLSVPRNVDPNLPGVQLIDIDQLNEPFSLHEQQVSRILKHSYQSMNRLYLLWMHKCAKKERWIKVQRSYQQQEEKQLT